MMLREDAEPQCVYCGLGLWTYSDIYPSRMREAQENHEQKGRENDLKLSERIGDMRSLALFMLIVKEGQACVLLKACLTLVRKAMQGIDCSNVDIMKAFHHCQTHIIHARSSFQVIMTICVSIFH